MIKPLALLAATLSLAACVETGRPSTLEGAAIGAGTGAVAGRVLGGSGRSTVAGAVLGGVVGGAVANGSQR